MEPKDDVDGGASSGSCDGSSDEGAPAEEEPEVDGERVGSRSLVLCFSSSCPSHGRRAAMAVLSTTRGCSGEKKPSNPRIPASLPAGARWKEKVLIKRWCQRTTGKGRGRTVVGSRQRENKPKEKKETEYGMRRDCKAARPMPCGVCWSPIKTKSLGGRKETCSYEKSFNHCCLSPLITIVSGRFDSLVPLSPASV